MAGIGHRGFMGRNKGGGCPIEALDFITTAGITDPTQQAAICQLVKDLKGVGSTTNNTDVWSKLVAFYPVVGGSASQHEFNLIDPSLFSLTISAGMTNGALGFLNPGSAYVLGGSYSNYFSPSLNVGMGAWVDSSFTTATNQCLMGTSRGTSGGGGSTAHILYFLAGSVLRYTVGGNIGSAFYNTTVVKGLHSNQRSADLSNAEYYHNGVLQATTPKTGSNDFDSADRYGITNISGAAIGGQFTGSYASCFYFHFTFTANEMIDLYDSILKFQTALGRN